MVQPSDRADSDAQSVPQFLIQKIYIKDASFEVPGAPQVFAQQGSPQAHLQLNSSTTAVGPGLHEVVLSVTVTAKHEDKVVFLVEVQQAGLFAVQGYSEHDLAAVLGAYCPNILFPFAREAVADLVAKGGFPALLLAPINFDMLYAQQARQQQH